MTGAGEEENFNDEVQKKSDLDGQKNPIDEGKFNEATNICKTQAATQPSH